MARNLGWRGIFFAGAITAMAGFVDGVGFIHLGGYFLSFMSGNSTRSSAALLTGDAGGWAMAMGFVGSFVGGVVLATVLTARAARYRRPIVMYLSGALLVTAALLGSLGTLGFGGACLLAASMGAVNVSYTRSGEVSLGLTYRPRRGAAAVGPLRGAVGDDHARLAGRGVRLPAPGPVQPVDRGRRHAAVGHAGPGLGTAHRAAAGKPRRGAPRDPLACTAKR